MTWHAHQGVTDMDVRGILYLFFHRIHSEGGPHGEDFIETD
jgi:hypothetical protein